jgi:TolB-like protein/Tfp pilus assembly protein PilF
MLEQDRHALRGDVDKQLVHCGPKALKETRRAQFVRENRLADIFISYGREDRELIRTLADGLEAAGFSVWWDRDIGGGAEFSRTIEEELGAAKTVIVAWSAASIGSHWVRDEADSARADDKLLPLSLDGVLPPLGFRQFHALDFKGWDQSTTHAAFVGLLNSLGHKASSPAPTRSREKSRWVKPSVAVLPFTNLSADKEIEFLADGIAEDIIAELSTNHHISVTARSSSFAYKNQSADVREVGKALGARYVVEGSVRKMGKRARVSTQFVNVETGAHIWANKFDHVLEELYDNPDDLVVHISGSVFAQLISAEQDRAYGLPANALGIWEHCVRASGGFGGAVFSGSVSDTRRTLENLEKAIESAPEYRLAHAIFSFGCNQALGNGAYEDHEQATLVDKAKKHLRIARAGSEEDLYCLTWIGAAETFSGAHDRAVRRLEHVLQRNPANADALFMIAQAYAYLGRHGDARDALERAMAIAPEAGFARFHPWYLGLLGYLAGRYEEALPFIRAQTVTSPAYGTCQALAAITTFILGDEGEAGKYIAKAKAHNPQLRPEKLFGFIASQHDRDKGAREYAILEELWAEQPSQD